MEDAIQLTMKKTSSGLINKHLLVLPLPQSVALFNYHSTEERSSNFSLTWEDSYFQVNFILNKSLYGDLGHCNWGRCQVISFQIQWL